MLPIGTSSIDSSMTSKMLFWSWWIQPTLVFQQAKLQKLILLQPHLVVIQEKLSESNTALFVNQGRRGSFRKASEVGGGVF